MPYCVECGFYTGLYEVGLERRNGKLGVDQKAKFQEGLCFCQDLFISDGFRERKCEYFEQIRPGSYSPSQYIALMKERLLKKLREMILALRARLAKHFFTRDSIKPHSKTTKSKKDL